MWGRHFANLLIGMFTLWAIFVVVAWLLGVLIMFPFVEVETDDIPLGRLHAIRLAVICSFAFYGVMHLIQGFSYWCIAEVDCALKLPQHTHYVLKFSFHSYCPLQ